MGSGRVRDPEGARKKSGSGLEADWKSFGVDRKQKGLGFNSCVVPSCSVLFWKANQTEKETGGTEVDIQTGDTGGNI